MTVPRPDDTSARGLVCARCTSRECCARPVPITIAELADIAKALALAPTAFATLTTPHTPGPGLSLRRDPEGRCVFSVHLGSHRRACGLASLAPLACRRFPEPAATNRPLPHCWRTWGDAELSDPELEREQLTSDLSQSALAARWAERTRSRSHPLDEAMLLDALVALGDEAREPP